MILLTGLALIGLDRFARDADGYVTTRSERISTHAYALVEAPPYRSGREGDTPFLRDLAGTIRIRTDSAGPLFVGIAPAPAVEAYLGDVRREESVRPVGDPAGRLALGTSAPSERPAELSFWTASTTGSGTQAVTWKVADGDWRIVLMNPDASPGITADLTVAARHPHLLAAGLGAAGGGLLLLLLASMAIHTALRRKPRRPLAQPRNPADARAAIRGAPPGGATLAGGQAGPAPTTPEGGAMSTLHHQLRGRRPASAPTAPRARLAELAGRHPVAAFFLLAFALSWLLWLAPALGVRGAAGSALLVAGIFGPALAAAAITRLRGGSLRPWLRELVRLRAGPRWYTAILGFPVVLVGATVGAFALTGGALDTGLLGERLLAYLPLLVVWTLAGAGEEPGWRGFALPRLLERTTPVRATLLLGFLWALWHLPLLAAADEPTHGLSALPLLGVTLLMLVAIVGYAFFYTYLWTRTRNVWLAILLHGSLTAAIAAFVLVPMDDQVGGTYAHLQLLTVVVVAAAVAALVVATRGRLGLEADRRPPAGPSPRLPLAGLVALAALTVAALPAAARAAPAGIGATTSERIDRFVEEQLEARAVPGFSLAIVQGGAVVHARGFGSADGAGTPVTADTPFVLGSVTKSFTALAVMQLVDAGDVDLDAAVARYVPELRLADGAERRVTVRHLLNQTSGIPGLAGGRLLRSVGDGTLLDAVRELDGTGLAAPPGMRFEYANANWVLLGLVIERTSGLSYGAYVEEHIFEPLGMRNSFAAPDAARAAGLALGHRYWFGLRVAHGPTSPDAVRPAGYLMSSAADMARYLAMYLNGGELDGRRLVSRGGLATLLRPEAAGELGPWADNAATRYAMGWFVGGPWDEPALLHPGRDPDSAAMIVLLPGQRLGIVTLANANHELPLPGGSGSLNRIPSGVVSLVLGAEPAPPMPLARFYLGFDALVLLLLAAIAWPAVRLLRRRDVALTRGRRAMGAARGAGEATLGALLLAAPMLSGQGYAGALLWWPDLAVVLLGAGGALLALGVIRIVLRLHARAPAVVPPAGAHPTWSRPTRLPHDRRRPTRGGRPRVREHARR